MPKTKFYAVHSGVNTGVFDTWNECKKNVIGIKTAKYKSFTKREDAENFYKTGISVPPKLEHEKEILYFYTDGSCVGNDGTNPSGWGYCCVMNEILLLEKCGRVKVNPQDNDFMGAEITTNNTGELTAIGQVFKIILELDLKPDIIIKTDSVYSINCIEENYKINKNVELINYIIELKKRAEFNGRKIKLEYIKAHSGHKWNEFVDKLANLGRTKII
jgi:ribonuclease HI